MNHKAKAYNLEKLKRDKKQEVIDLQKEIAEIETQINFHTRMYKLNNERSDKCSDILSGFDRENIRRILKFIIFSMSENDYQGYLKNYKGIDIDELLNHDEFFDFIIIEIGKPTLIDMKKRIIEIKEIDGEDQMVVTGFQRGKETNFNKRLQKKLTKRTVIEEAKRLTSC